MITPAALDATLHARLLDVDPPDARRFVHAEARRLEPLLTDGAVDAVVARVLARVHGFGSLDDLLADPDVTEVLVNAGRDVWIERNGALERLSVTVTPAETERLVERMVGPLGLRADRSAPIVDARLPDGSRVHAVVPPLAIDGPTLSIRRFAARHLTLDAFAPPAVVAILEDAVHRRDNMLISGATSSGKTTLLNALATLGAQGERIITIEDAAELRVRGEHVVRLEARPPTADGTAAVTIRDLVRAALRMRPDRIVVGEVRGPEALDMVQAMSTGHDGSLATCHANSAADALRRVEVMMVQAAPGLPLVAVREVVHAAVDVVVHVVRGRDGRRRVATVAEVDPDPTMEPRVRVLEPGASRRRSRR
jgi:pilus assembly protein CpaF